MEKISTCIWFDRDVKEIVHFYTSIFENSKIGDTTYYSDSSAKHSGREPGSVLAINFMLEGREFVALNGGPLFKPNPTISFTVSCSTAAEVDALYEKLVDGGAALMPLDKYHFSDRYAWVNDKYGVSWQLILLEHEQKIAPTLMFVGEQAGKAGAAIDYYISCFKNSKVLHISHYGANDPNGGVEGTVQHATFSLNGEEFMAMDAPGSHDMQFTEGTSFMVFGANQEEIDEYWNKFSATGDGQCGWVKDQFGVSWQVVPTILNGMLVANNGEKFAQVMDAVMKMKKLNIEELEKAYSATVAVK